MKSFFLIASLPVLALAMPFTMHGREGPALPQDAARIAFDEANKQLLAFDKDGKSLGSFPMTNSTTPRRREANTCVPMLNEEIKDIKGLQRLRDEADKNWGNKKRKEVVNDKDFPDNPANVCTDDSGAVMVYEGKPSCDEPKQGAKGTLEGGKIILQNEIGVVSEQSTEVTKTSSWGIDKKFGATVKIPEILDVTNEYTIKTEFTNARKEGTTTRNDFRTTQRIEQPVDADAKDCEVHLETKTCHSVGKGSIKMIATGWIWFEYEDKVQGHYKWALKLEDILPNVDDRSQAIDLKSSGKIESTAHFSSKGCSKGATETKV